MKLAQQVQVHVRDEDHLRVRCRLGTLPIGREGEIARRENTRLGILDVHVMHTWQITHAASDGYEALILDRSGLGADTDTRIAILRIGQERHEKNLHSLIGHDARQLRKLHVVTDQDTDLGAIGLESLDGASSSKAPALTLIRRDMNLLVCLVSTVTTAKEPDVV